MKKYRVTLGILAIFLFSATWIGSRLWADTTKRNVYTSLEVFQKVLQITRDNYVREVDLNDMIEDAMNGMLRELDPYSMYMNPEEYENLSIAMEGEFSGLGVTIGIADDWLTIISPLEGSPAFAAGILAGDKIVEIEGKSTEGILIEEAVSKLRGKPGTEVTITVARQGVDEVMEFTITREVIKLNAVRYVTKLTPDIVYIKFSKFSRTAHREVADAIDSMFNKENASKLILDIRYNSGGYLNEGVDVSDIFLERDKAVVQTRGRSPKMIRTYRSHSEPLLGDYPMVVLTDYGSASAAEILAGALQDWERALVIGDTTFGKGSVQTIYPLHNEGMLKLTSAYWYTPSGRCIDKHRAELEEDEAKGKQSYHTLGRRKRLLPNDGAIAPDILVEGETRMDITSDFIMNRVFFSYVVDFLSANPDFELGFEITDEMIEGLIEEARSRDVEFTDEEVEEARDQLAFRIKLEIANQKWGEEGWFKVSVDEDPVIQKAVELLTKAQTSGQLFGYID
ncbi:PDZ domain-containing protein [candidate division WOR-3 bacterium]|uniref:PDZ domain-containing protein n=1 Tax=candidate division WOR-3 bacterium TaxID=2052148 RepID=A0A9D5K986_UNCW3|nr:PDZ domain-containing protein [candidate division WOR-3 bacterium]MBD3364445.1 PDZ domain-containing protein [candidate division WOR-3 bacterium]